MSETNTNDLLCVSRHPYASGGSMEATRVCGKPKDDPCHDWPIKNPPPGPPPLPSLRQHEFRTPSPAAGEECASLTGCTSTERYHEGPCSVPSAETVGMPLVDDPDKGRGLYQKFIVRRADPAAQAKHRHCSHFVLDMTHDRLALSAIKAYAAEARVHGYEALAYDLYDLYVPATSPIPAPASEPVASERSVTPSPAAGEGERTAMSASERSLFAMLHQVYAECLTPIAAAFGFDGPELDESFVEYMHERAGELARLREKSAALTRREASETMGARAWRPIETAPKDETWVILFTPDGVQCGYWGATYFGMNPAWVQYAHRSECEEVNGEPTHWMPLPEPPSNGREASEGELEGDALQRLWDHADAQPSDYAAFVLGWRNALAWVRKDQNRAPRMADIRREASEGERLRREACEALGAQIDAWTRVASNGLHDRELYRLYEQACAQAGRTYDEAVTAAIAAARAKEEK